MRRGTFILLLCAAAVGLAGALLVASDRAGRCADVPLITADLLPTPDFDDLAPGSPAGVLLPAGWSAPAPGVQVGAFTVSGSGSSFQLLGIANALHAPPVPVRPGSAYCVSAQALADAASPTQLRVTFAWLDAAGAELRADTTPWQAVRRWDGPGDRGGWSAIGGVFAAPPGASRLAVRFHPASDDRVYLDQIHIRRTLAAPQPAPDPAPAPVTVLPWPDGRQAALSFSFDWETTMGGLIHSRSVDDPNFDQDPVDRGMRMRAGITTTVEIFRPYAIPATYYATGYNFLDGNTERRTFMGDPIFSWANRSNRWQTDAWTTTPWFDPDPFGTVATHPAWYFGDLVPLLQREGHAIQSHTFSHLYGGLASVDEWRADLTEWNAVAAEAGVPPARSLAFPWSSSAGMRFESWRALAEAGITSVTRTNWNPRQPQYHLVSAADPVCRPVPGHETILACPDFYLTEQSAAEAPAVIDRALAAGGVIDIWAHTEEVVSPEEIAIWRAVVADAAARRDAGQLWIAPLEQIAARQQAAALVRVTPLPPADGVARADDGALRVAVTSAAGHDLPALTLRLPFAPAQVSVVGLAPDRFRTTGSLLIVDLPAGATLEVTAWPA